MKKLMLLIVLFLLAMQMQAQVKLPWIISDNMVIQRDIPVKIWGWASKGEKVTVTIDKQKVTATADAKGNWMVQLKPLTAGGPFSIKIKGKNEITLQNILVGDVWVCGGQSNMEWPANMSRNWEKDKLTAENNNIRLFYVPKKLAKNLWKIQIAPNGKLAI